MYPYIKELDHFEIRTRLSLRQPIPVMVYRIDGEFMACGATVNSYGITEEDVWQRFQHNLVSVYYQIKKEADRDSGNPGNKNSRIDKKCMMRYKVMASYLNDTSTSNTT